MVLTLLYPPPPTQAEIDAEHMAHPEPGDFWHSQGMPIWTVLAVQGADVIVCGAVPTQVRGEFVWMFRDSYGIDHERFTDTLLGWPASVQPGRNRHVVTAWSGAR